MLPSLPVSRHPSSRGRWRAGCRLALSRPRCLKPAPFTLWSRAACCACCGPVLQTRPLLKGSCLAFDNDTLIGQLPNKVRLVLLEGSQLAGRGA